MAAMQPFAGLQGVHLTPTTFDPSARSARAVGPPGSVRRLEPLAAVFLGLHGLVVLAHLDAALWQWAGVGLVLLLGLLGIGERGSTRMIPLRAGAILVVGVALMATTGGAGGWFQAWPFALVAVYPLALPGPSGVVLAGLTVLAYVAIVRLAPSEVGPAVAVARGVLLAGLGALAWAAASAYARVATVAFEASLELGRRERLGRAILDALPDPTSVLDPQGRIMAVNQAWVRFAVEHLADVALGEVGESYPRACAAAAAAGYHGLEPAADGVRAVLGGEAPRFHCRYQSPSGSPGGHEVTVTPLADGAGAVVTHRETPAVSRR
jgi:PAS domain-containing protein